MNHCMVPQNNAFPACDEARNAAAFISDRKDTVFCPKPRRVGVLSHGVNDSIRPFRFHFSHPTDALDSKAGIELLDIILTKGVHDQGVHGSDQGSSQVASSPPFFCGSPPTRATNPLVHDAHFVEEKFLAMPPTPSSVSSSPSSASASARKGCVRTKFAVAPAAVRIEGFDCLDRDRRNCRISAVA